MLQRGIGTDLAGTIEGLGSDGCSGILTVTGGSSTALILLDAGRVVFASSTGVPPLGQGLVKKGLITTGDLARVLRIQREQADRQLLVSIMHDMGLVSRADAETEILEHVVAVLRHALDWPDPQVNFDELDSGMGNVLGAEQSEVRELLARAIAG